MVLAGVAAAVAVDLGRAARALAVGATVLAALVGRAGTARVCAHAFFVSHRLLSFAVRLSGGRAPFYSERPGRASVFASARCAALTRPLLPPRSRNATRSRPPGAAWRRRCNTSGRTAQSPARPPAPT